MAVLPCPHTPTDEGDDGVEGPAGEATQTCKDTSCGKVDNRSLPFWPIPDPGARIVSPTPIPTCGAFNAERLPQVREALFGQTRCLVLNSPY